MVACRFAPRRCSYKKAVNLSPLVGAPAPGANGCVPVRTEAVLLQKGGQPLSPGRSTRPGCEWLPARFAPRRCSYKKAGQPLSLGRSTRPGCEGCLPVRTVAVLLQNAGQPLTPGRSPLPGCEGCLPVRTGAVLLQKGGQPPSLGRSTRPGCEGCLAGSHRGGAPATKPVNLSPGAKGAARMPADKTSSSKVSTLMLEPHREN